MSSQPKTARLAGGLLDGTVMEIEPGARELSLAPMLTLFGALDTLPPDEARRVAAGAYVYRFARLERVEDPKATGEGAQRAVFEFDGEEPRRGGAPGTAG